LDTGRLTYGPVSVAVEREFATRFLFPSAPPGVFVNSGSSAVMLAVEAACLRAGATPPDVITTALGFPTTLAAAVRSGRKVIVIDSEPDTLNFVPAQLEDAARDNPGAVLVLTAMLGNPFNVETMLKVADGHLVIIDCCDALGSKWADRHLAEYGAVACFSFYPAHHITCGEGGMVLSRTPSFAKTVRSLRDWGRDCECLPNQDDRCGRRFNRMLGGVGWDHKFMYSWPGYNLKPLELQGAMLRVQMERFDELHARRMANVQRYDDAFAGKFHRFFIKPRVLSRAEASWMAYPLIIRPDAGFVAHEFAIALESEGVGTRRPLGGDLTRQRAFKRHPRIQRAGSLAGTREIMKRVVSVGCHPRLSRDDIDRIIETAIRVAEALRKHAR